MNLGEQRDRSLEALERQIRQIVMNQRELDSRLRTVENSRVFRTLRWVGTRLFEWRGRAGQKLLHSPLHPLYLKVVRPPSADIHYQRWLTREHAREAAPLASYPLISILMPVHNPERKWLDEAVNSLVRQSYASWELSVCDDASADSWVAEYFTQRARENSRIRFVRSEHRVGISGAMNRAGQDVSGAYVGFLDQDDILAPNALQSVAEVLQRANPEVIYTDEDRLNSEGVRVEPVFKPGWSPDLLTSCMYMGHFLVISRQALDRAGWFRSEFDGSQDYDLVLRITDQSNAVHHIPRILYHWRKHAGSTAADAQAKPYTHRAGRRALEDAIRRRGWQADVVDGAVPNSYRTRRQVTGSPLASIVVCSRNAKLLSRFLRQIERRTSWPDREIVVVQHTGANDEAMRQVLTRFHPLVVPYTGPFNFADMNNRGAQTARGEILIFMNDDVEPLTPEWMTALIAQVQRPEVGVAGAKLLYPSGAVQHAGIALGLMDGTGHPHRRTFGGGYWNWLDMTRNVSAVTGACLAVSRRVFDQLHGFDVNFPVNYNDVDFCLRVRKAGYEVIYEPAARLRHRECASRSPGTSWDEREAFYQRWSAKLEQGDPFYSPHLTTAREDASLRSDSSEPGHRSEAPNEAG